ncbi:phage portal protein [Eubacterium maltosivorans]|uniref:phage portal protein n=1 Tax=Eubacterium maltosivorans TaxID=2041044 RepID=UPI001A9A9A25|nr:phage portal protein [Eubacterium maltosivorans]
MSDDIFRVSSGTPMTPDLLAKHIQKHKQLVQERFKPLIDAYKNDYKILHQSKKAEYKPDNHIPVNFAKYIVDTMNGFFLGIPIKVSHNDEVIAATLEYLDQYNDQDDGNAELSKICSIYGRGYEMYFEDECSEIGITHLDPTQAFMIYDDSILERPLYFVRYYQDSQNIERGSWSDGQMIQHFENRGTYVFTDDPKIHGFDGVPATEFVENEERMGIFESVLPMINAYNKALSEKANDVDYFADAYLKVLGAALSEDKLTELRDTRIINLEGDDAEKMIVEFLQKPDADATQENLIDRLERLIFQISMVANISDENFGQSSGIALKYKLQSMSNLAKTKERKFTSGMNRRYKLIFSNPIISISGTGIHREDWVGIRYKFTPNIPANLLEESQVAGNLKGLVSQETQLSVLSIVDNAKQEIERMDEEWDKTAYSTDYPTDRTEEAGDDLLGETPATTEQTT